MPRNGHGHGCRGGHSTLLELQGMNTDKQSNPYDEIHILN